MMAAAFLRNFLLGAAFFALALAVAGKVRAETIGLEVQAASLDRDKHTNDVVVVIELSAAAKTAFENFTQRNVGRNIEIRLGTTVLLKARLVEKISGGIIRATTKFSEDEGRRLAAQLTRGTLITLENVDD